MRNFRQLSVSVVGCQGNSDRSCQFSGGQLSVRTKSVAGAPGSHWQINIVNDNDRSLNEPT
jgi:hypothetical protein